MLFYEVIASIVLENKSKTNKKFPISTLTFNDKFEIDIKNNRFKRENEQFLKIYL